MVPNFFYDYTTVYNYKGIFTGIPRVVYSLYQGLSSLDINIVPVIFDDELNNFRLIEITNNKIFIKDDIPYNAGDKLFSAGANWAHASYNKAIELRMRRGLKSFFLFHDLIPVLFPYFYDQGAGFGCYFQQWSIETMRLATHCFAFSECTKKDLLNECSSFSIEPSISVIKLGDDRFYDDQDHQNDSNILILQKYILSVGTLEYRKNHAVLLDAYRILSDLSIEVPLLYIIGKEGWMNNNIRFQIDNDIRLKNKVFVLDNIDDFQLAQFYKHCEFTVYPSYYEGWGMPVSESLFFGKPCICSNTSSMLEIAPHLTEFADPYNANSWALKIIELSQNDKKKKFLEDLIIRNYKSTSWQYTAKQILAQMNY